MDFGHKVFIASCDSKLVTQIKEKRRKKEERRTTRLDTDE